MECRRTASQSVRGREREGEEVRQSQWLQRDRAGHWLHSAPHPEVQEGAGRDGLENWETQSQTWSQKDRETELEEDMHRRQIPRGRDGGKPPEGDGGTGPERQQVQYMHHRAVHGAISGLLSLVLRWAPACCLLGGARMHGWASWIGYVPMASRHTQGAVIFKLNSGAALIPDPGEGTRRGVKSGNTRRDPWASP